MKKGIDAQQKKIIWAVAKAGGVEKEDLYAAIFHMFEVERMSALSWTQAELLIRELRRKQAGLGPDKMTPDQYRAVLAYASRLSWTREHLRNYVKKQTGVEEIIWLTVHQARAILAGLEKIKQKEEQHGLQRSR